MTLSRAERDALPAEAFAVPAKRLLPIHDAKHVAMARGQIERASGITDEERQDARLRIAAKADELGVGDRRQISALRLEAMALDLPDVSEHPNRMPFSGVLVKLDQASDSAPHGSRGKKVVMSMAAAQEALPSLLGMAVNFTENFDGHNVQQKIGVITGATIEGVDLLIDGFIYAADFPEEASFIKANKNTLGFSFEAQQILVQSLDAAPLVITACVFTGASILRKDKAAFTTTSLAASAAGDIEMTKEELEAILAAALKPVTEKIETIEAGQAALDAKVEAAAAAATKPSDEEVAAATELLGRAGIRIAASTAAAPDASVITAAVEAAVKPLNEKIGTLETKVADGIAAARDTAKEPERKTLSPQITSLMARAGVAEPEEGKKLPAADLDRILASSSISERLRLKAEFARAGLID